MTDKEKLIKIKSLADKMYYAAFNLTTDASLLRKAMDDYHQFLIYEYHKEEPVSEELEGTAWNYADKKCHLDIAVFTPNEVKKERGKMQFAWQDLYNAVMFGANWQKAKDESTTDDLSEYINGLSKQFPDVSFAKLSRIAVRVAKWQEKQDQSTIELAEDHAYFAGSEAMREKILSEIEEAYKKGGVIEAMKIIRELKK